MLFGRIIFLIAVSLFTTVAPVSAENQITTVVVLVRHAEKASDGGKDPSLSPAGQTRAEALVDALENAGIERIITTQYQRTRATAQSVAKRKGITPEVIPVLQNIEEHVSQVTKAIVDRSGEAVLVVGHSNTIPQIIYALGGPKLATLEETNYANLFVLILKENEPTRFLHSWYGAPDKDTISPSVDDEH